VKEEVPVFREKGARLRRLIEDMRKEGVSREKKIERKKINIYQG